MMMMIMMLMTICFYTTNVRYYDYYFGMKTFAQTHKQRAHTLTKVLSLSIFVFGFELKIK